MDEQEQGTEDRIEFDLQAALDAWRRAHPHATFAEMEEGVAAILHQARGPMLEQLAARASNTGSRCPHCGRSMTRRGAHHRELLGEGDVAVTLHRPYYVCPDCGTGLFPPG